MTPIAQFTEALKGGYRPEMLEIANMLRELQPTVENSPEFLWMNETPATLADEIESAIVSSEETDHADSADDWYDRRRDDRMMAQYEVK